MIALAVLLLAAARTVFADAGWATFDRGTACTAVVRGQRIVHDRTLQSQAGFTFDRTGLRNGQFAARLSRPLRPGTTALLTLGDRPFLLVATGPFAWSSGPAQEAAIIAAARSATGMRIEARAEGGGRFTDYYPLAGAPGAIDAAAACAAHR